jgi:hypothetical protein
MPLLNQQRKHIDVPPPDPHYPAFRFHRDGRQMVVTARHLEPKEPGWGVKPVPQPEPVEVTPEARIEQLEAQLAEAKAETEAQRKQFDKAWNKLTVDFDALQAAHDALAGTQLPHQQPEESAPAPKPKKGK